MKVLRHVMTVFLSLFLLLGLPLLHFWNAGRLAFDVDAVSRATADLPEMPSGEYVVYVNRQKHHGTLDQWKAFFSEEDYGILLENVHCLVIDGDSTGEQLAKRYQARLVKDQMTLRRDNGVLVASRLEQGQYDLAILSAEMAALQELSDLKDAEAFVIREDGP